MVDNEQALKALVAERAVRRRAQRMWRVVSVVAGVGLGLLGWGWGLLAFCVFQFLVYATYWHSVRSMEERLGMPEDVQTAFLAKFDSATPS